jgi:CARDB
MARFGPLLTVAVVTALTLPPSAAFAQPAGPSGIPPGGPRIPFPNLIIPSVAPVKVTCIRPSFARITMSVSVKNNGTTAAVMPPTMPTLGRYWVGVWDLNTFPGVMAIAAGPPPQLKPGETKLFVIDVIARQGVGPSGAGFGINTRVDPANLILESSENDNDHPTIFTSKTLCQ